MKKNNSGYYTNNHSCFLLQYHLVLVTTKYRYPILAGELRIFLEAYFRGYFEDHGFIILEMNLQPDHVHILFDAPPQINLSEFINGLKSASSRIARKRFVDTLKTYYWKPYFWSLSYFIGCVSERTEDAVKNIYEISNLGIHPRPKNFGRGTLPIR